MIKRTKNFNFATDPVFVPYYDINSETYTIICMQNIDFEDYNEFQFVVDSEGNYYYSEFEGDVVDFLNKHYKPESIDRYYIKHII